MIKYLVRGLLKVIPDNLKADVNNLQQSVDELKAKADSEAIPGERFSLQSQLRDMQAKLRDAQTKVLTQATPVLDFRVEIWDEDERFDDRLGASKTDSLGIFEIQFTDEEFRQHFVNIDWAPNIYFDVYQGRELIGKTKPQKIIMPSISNPNPQTLSSLVLLDEDEDETNYRIDNARIEIIEDEDDKRPRQDFQERAITVYDVLPTANQVAHSSSSSQFSYIDGNGGSLQSIVDSALSEVLGRTLGNDPKAFLNSLNQTFTAKETNGRTQYEWSPRSYTAVDNDLGGTVSGAQASMYHRAKAALKDALPLLDGLTPLNPAADQQNMEAMRGIIRTEMMELVKEMGATGGPRVQRVDNLFYILLGKDDENGGDESSGQIKNLADVFGLSPKFVNTVDEEQNYGNFLILRDYLVSLRSSWNDYVQDTGGGAYVGPQLVLLSQALATVAQSVQDTCQIMDLVFLGNKERQAVSIDFRILQSPPGMPPGIAFPLPDGTGYLKKDLAKLVPPMTVDGLLTWAWSFGAQEGPALAKAGGKIGIAEAIADTAESLMILVQAASFVPVRNTAFRREGVLRALRDLAFQLYQVRELAKEIIPPPTVYEPDDIDSLPFASANNGQTIPMRRLR